MTRLPIFAAALLLAGVSTLTPAAAEPARHNGLPVYLNGRSGAVMSDFGSHFCWNAEGADMRLAHLARHDCLTQAKRDTVEGTEWVGILAGAPDPPADPHILFDPAGEREIRFSPSGWEETTADSDLAAEARVAVIETDVLLVALTIRNEGTGTLTLTPRIVVEGEVSEAAWAIADSPGLFAIATRNDPLAPRKTITTTYALSLPIAGFRWESDGSGSYGAMADCRPTPLAPGGVFEFHYVAAMADDEARSRDLALAAARRVGSDPASIFDEVQADWDDFLGSFPPLHTDDPALLDAFRMSAALLRMNLYEPRGAMEHVGSFPAKGHYNFFWLWDTGFHALAQSEWDVRLAEENLRLVYDGQKTDPSDPERGMVPNKVNEDLAEEYPFFSYSQSPVLAWAVREFAERETDDARRLDFLSRSYEVGDKFWEWWMRRRDRDGNGLAEYLCGWEGWDNSPRWDGLIVRPPIPLAILNAVDLNAWLYVHLREMESWAADLDMGEDTVRRWRDEASRLGARIDATMWSEEDGCWWDVVEDEGGGGWQLEVNTPAAWFPAFARSTPDLSKVKRAIEEHVLDPAEYWGAVPIPTVAYDDPRYDPSDYWRGPTWINIGYVAAQMLYQWGYETEAADLARRLLALVSGKDTIWEYFDSQTGEGIRTQQYGWTGALAIELLLDRYQREGILLQRAERPATRREGYLRRLLTWPTETTFYEIGGRGRDLPLTEIESMDGRPIESSGRIALRLSDPYGALPAEARIEVRFPSIGRAEVWEIAGNGAARAVAVSRAKGGIAFDARLTGETSGVARYEVERGGQGRSSGGGCAVTPGDRVGWGLLAPLLAGALLALGSRRPARVAGAVVTLALALAPTPALATMANVRDASFYSPHLSREMPYRIYLPSGYDDPENARQRYPTLFLFHGHEAAEDYTSHMAWTDRTGVEDYADAYSMIVVFPEGLNGWYTDYWTSEPGRDEFERYVVDDLIPHVEATYRAGATRETRAIGGNSMGGFGAFKTALLHPDLFCSVFSLSGILYLDAIGIASYFEWLVSSNLANVFGPFERNEIYYQGNDPMLLVPTFIDWVRNSGSHMRIAFRSGVLDYYGTQIMASWMHDRLGALGVPHEWGIDPGDMDTASHTWTYWDSQIGRMLDFTWQAFRHPPERPATWSLRTVEPAFQVWGWSFDLDREGWAWIVLDEVGPEGFRVSGEGARGHDLAVRTPAIYEPGARYRVAVAIGGSRAGESVDVTAGGDGSLAFTVRLVGGESGEEAPSEIRMTKLVGGSGGGGCAIGEAASLPGAASLAAAIAAALAWRPRRGERRGAS